MSLAVQNCGTVKLRGSPNLSTVAGGASRTVSRNGRRGDAAMAAARRVATRHVLVTLSKKKLLADMYASLGINEVTRLVRCKLHSIIH